MKDNNNSIVRAVFQNKIKFIKTANIFTVIIIYFLNTTI